MEEELTPSRLGAPEQAWAALPLSEAQPVWALLSLRESVAGLAVFAYSSWETFLEIHSESWGESRGPWAPKDSWVGFRGPDPPEIIHKYCACVCICIVL